MEDETSSLLKLTRMAPVCNVTGPNKPDVTNGDWAL
jgi:hypothetical protein